jgi:hypothetical protein
MLFSVQELHICILMRERERIHLQYRAGDMLFVLVSGWIDPSHSHLFEGEGGDRVWCQAI